jgi:hypothetical protein
MGDRRTVSEGGRAADEHVLDREDRGGDQMRFTLLTKNSIVIKKIGNKFSKMFAKSNRMVFVMPENIKNAQVILPLNMDLTLKSLVECSHKWEDMNNE